MAQGLYVLPGFGQRPFLVRRPNWENEEDWASIWGFLPSTHIADDWSGEERRFMMITILVFTASKGSSTFEFYFGEYFQSIRILFKHCGLDRKNTNKEDCRVKSESEQITQDCRAESESEQSGEPRSSLSVDEDIL